MLWLTRLYITAVTYTTGHIIWYHMVNGMNTCEYSRIMSTHTRLSGNTRKYSSLASGTSTHGGILIECECPFGQLDEYSPLASDTRASLCHRCCSVSAGHWQQMASCWFLQQRVQQTGEELPNPWQRAPVCYPRSSRVAAPTGRRKAQVWDSSWSSKPGLLHHSAKPQLPPGPMVILLVALQLPIGTVAYNQSQLIYCPDFSTTHNYI
jgi:hypothetical protein